MDFLTSLINSMPGAVAQGLIWGIMAIGVYITYRILDVADLTVDGSLGTGGAVCVVLVLNGVPVGVALLAATLVGMLAGLVTGLFHTACGIPAILAGILTQLALYSVNLRIMGTGTGGGKANLPISVDKYSLLVSARYVRALAANNPIIVLVIFCAILIGVLYWFFGTEMGCSLRATGANQHMARAQGINTNVTMVLGLMIWAVARSKTLDKIALHSTISSTNATSAQLEVKVGDKGVALTRLALVGNAEINGKSVEVKSAGAFINPGTPIRVKSVSEALITVVADED